MWDLHIQFKVNNEERFTDFIELFEVIKNDKNNGIFNPEDSKWIDLFPKYAIDEFWWPTEEENRKHWELYQSLPFEERFTDPRLQVPWDFESLLESISTGEYKFRGCELTNNEAKVVFQVWSFPYGGYGAIEFLIKSFGFEVTDLNVN